MPVEENGDVERELDVRAGLGLFASEGSLHQLLAIARQIELRPGAVLYEVGTPVRSVYQVTRGTLEMRLDGFPTWTVTGRGTLGFLDFMRARPHSRTAVATSESRILALDANNYLEFVEDNFEVGHQILAQLAGNLVEGILGVPDPALMLGRTIDQQNRPRSYANVEVSLVDRVILLQRVPAFATGSVQALANLAQNAREARYEAGEVIVTAGQRTDEIMVLVGGQIELTSPTTDLKATRSPVDLLAGPAELATTARTLTATAIRDSVVLQIDREELLDRIEEHFELSQSMFSYIATQTEVLNNAKAIQGKTL